MAKRNTATQKSPATGKTAQPTAAVTTTTTQTPGVAASKVIHNPQREVTQTASAKKVITHEMIAHRAQQIWKREGGPDLENWLRAERELRAGN